MLSEWSGLRGVVVRLEIRERLLQQVALRQRGQALLLPLGVEVAAVEHTRELLHLMVPPAELLCGDALIRGELGQGGHIPPVAPHLEKHGELVKKQLLDFTLYTGTDVALTRFFASRLDTPGVDTTLANSQT